VWANKKPIFGLRIFFSRSVAILKHWEKIGSRRDCLPARGIPYPSQKLDALPRKYYNSDSNYNNNTNNNNNNNSNHNNNSSNDHT